MIVEGRGIGFWTRVRFPPGPLDHEAANPLRGNYYSVCENVFALIVDLDVFEKKQKCSFPRLKSEKEKAILMAFKEMKIIVKK